MPGGGQLFYSRRQPDAGCSKIIVGKIACFRSIVLGRPFVEIRPVPGPPIPQVAGVKEIVSRIKQFSVKSDLISPWRPRCLCLSFAATVDQAVAEGHLLDDGTVAENLVQ